MTKNTGKEFDDNSIPNTADVDVDEVEVDEEEDTEKEEDQDLDAENSDENKPNESTDTVRTHL